MEVHKVNGDSKNQFVANIRPNILIILVSGRHKMLTSPNSERHTALLFWPVEKCKFWLILNNQSVQSAAFSDTNYWRLKLGLRAASLSLLVSVTTTDGEYNLRDGRNRNLLAWFSPVVADIDDFVLMLPGPVSVLP